VLDSAGRSPRRYASLSSRVVSFTRDVLDVCKILRAEYAHAPDDYLVVAAQLHEKCVEDFNTSPKTESPPDPGQVLRWVVAANSDAWTAVRKKWRLGGLIGVEFFVRLLGAYHVHDLN
jgi:hypothetical protein